MKPVLSCVFFTTALLIASARAPDAVGRSSDVRVLSAGQQPAVPQDNFFESNGVRIRHVEHGQGPPVVLIQGYTGNLERHWINPGVFANLAKDHRVITRLSWARQV